MSNDEPNTFRIPDFPRETDEAPETCCWCEAIVHEDEGACCERCGEPVHAAACSTVSDKWECVCLGCLTFEAEFVAKEGA